MRGEHADLSVVADDRGNAVADATSGYRGHVIVTDLQRSSESFPQYPVAVADDNAHDPSPGQGLSR
jgi:hypothetical protein